MKAPECRLCGVSHWSWEGHDTRGVEPREVAREFGGARVKAVVVPEVVKRVRVEVPMCEGPDCENEVVRPKRGPMPRFCSNRCRMKAARMEEGE